MKRLRLIIGISMALWAGGVSAETSRDVNFAGGATQTQSGNHAAIVVGVEHYDERLTGFRPLDYSADDAKLIGSALHSIGYSAQQVEILTDTQASKDIVLNRIRQRAKALGKDGTLVFFFSGHGFAQGDENYLATYGAVASELGASGLAVRDVVAAIRQSGVRRAVLLLDACRNDPTPGSKSGSAGLAAVNAGEGIQILLSTGRGDVSWEHPDLQHGVFSYFLANGLRGGKQQFSQLADYVEREVTAWTVSRKVQTQKPFRSGEHRGGDFLLAPTQNFVSIDINERTDTGAVSTVSSASVANLESDQVDVDRPASNGDIAGAVLAGVMGIGNDAKGLISDRYLDNSDGTITDTKTQLTWKKCSEGQSGDNCSGKPTQYKWDDAMVKFGNGEWRLPTADELKSLVYCSNGTHQDLAWSSSSCGDADDNADKKSSVMIDTQAFPNTTSIKFWSLSPYIQFSYGGGGYRGMVGGGQVRLVRSGQ